MSGSTGDGAVLVRGRHIASYGYSRGISDGKETYTISGITCALTDWGARLSPDDPLSLFCTCFPNLEEMKQIVASRVERVYFMGKVHDPQVVKFANTIAGCGIPLEIIRLER